MKLIKTASLSLIATLFKMLSALVINKCVSIFVGPTGIATLGQLQNFIQITSTISSAGLSSGVVSLTSKYKSDHRALENVWSNVFTSIILISILTSLMILLFSKKISIYIFHNTTYHFVIVIFACLLCANNANLIFLSMINGLKEIKKYIYFLITQSIYSLLISSLLIYFWGLEGALIALVTSQIFVFFLSLNFCRRYINEFGLSIRFKFDRKVIKELSRYGFMAITSAIVGPISFFMIRNYLGDNLGWDYAGYWQSMWYISNMYLLVISGALSTYYLPRLSEISDNDDVKSELFKVLKLIIPIAIGMSLFIYIVKEWLIYILFSDDFLLMLPLFKWQLVGDVLKIIAWAFSYVLIAKARSKIFIALEVIYFTSWTLIAVYFTDIYGLVGTSYAHAMNNFIYLICVSSLVFFLLRKRGL